MPPTPRLIGFTIVACVAATLVTVDRARADDTMQGLPDLCTDRPTKASAPCTVPTGRFQIESDAFNVTFDRTGGVDTHTYFFTDPTLKLGVTSKLDVEASLAPLVEITTFDRASGATTRDAGVGDLYLRAKLNLAGDGGDAAFGIAIVPYVKIPTARTPIGDGAVEFGVQAPTSISLPAKFSLSLDPEIDLLKNAADSGRHANMINLIGISRPFGAVTFAGEFWSDVDFDPTGTVTQYSGDVAVSWIPSRHKTYQIDGGLNFGLNRVTPTIQAYIGVSHRF